MFFVVGGNQDAEEKPGAAIVGRIEHDGALGAQDGNDDFVEILNAAVRNGNAASESRTAETLTSVESVKGFSVGNTGIFLKQMREFLERTFTAGGIHIERNAVDRQKRSYGIHTKNCQQKKTLLFGSN